MLNLFHSIAGTPYAGGTFRIKLCLGKEFPIGPPKAYFMTKVFHPNVAKNGEICVNTLKKDWKPDLGIKHILLVRRYLNINVMLSYFIDHQLLLLTDHQMFANRS